MRVHNTDSGWLAELDVDSFLNSHSGRLYPVARLRNSLSSSSSESNVQPGLGATGKAALTIISEATGESDP